MNHRTTLLINVFFLIASLVWSQSIDMSLLKNIVPRSIGPAGSSGRITSIDVAGKNKEKILIGAASGGVWLSENGGDTWKSIFDNQDLLNIGAVKFDPTNSDIIWVGTGEGNVRNSHDYGQGIFKSIDGGRTWIKMGLEKTRLIHRILINSSDNNIIYVGVLGSAWNGSKERGFFKSIDGGKTWNKKLYINDRTGVADLVLDPGNPNKLLAAMWQFNREPWFFTSGGEGSGLYLSYDAGESWKKITHKEGLPPGELGRIGLAIAPSDSQIVYALVEAKENALLKSTDGGHKWNVVSKKNIGNRPFYYSDIFVDPQNENRIYNLFSIVTVSDDGGNNFKPLIPYRSPKGIHPDHHAFWIDDKNPNYIIDGNDGGLAISKDRGRNWRYITNLPLSQFYHINFDMETPYNVYGGMQDNGSWKGPAYTWQRGGIRNVDWQEVNFGDGFDVVPINDSLLYAMYQGGNLSLINTNTGQNLNIQPYQADPNIMLRFNWNAGIAIDPNDKEKLYFGSQFLHFSEDRGKSWSVISPDLTTNDTLKQKQHLSGGLTIDDTRAENYTTITCIEISKHNSSQIWVGTDDGNLQVTNDGGNTWKNTSQNLKKSNHGSWINQIVCDPHKTNAAYVVVNDYRRGDITPFVYYTTNLGQSYQNIINTKQVKGHSLSIAPDPVVSNLLWLGTEFGLYVSIDKGENWTKYHKGMPPCPVSDLKIHPRERDLIIGTYGRSAFILDDINIFREMALGGPSLSHKSFKIFSPKPSYLHYTNSFRGVRFQGDSEFLGVNRRNGAQISLWINPDSIKVTKKAKVLITNLEKDTIRQFETKVDTGYYRIYWNLRNNGPKFPSHNRSENNHLPSGQWVIPGIYNVFVTLDSVRDSTKVEVKYASHVTTNIASHKKKKDQYGEYKKWVNACSMATQKLKQAQSSNDKFVKSYSHLPDSIKSDLKNKVKAVDQRIDSLMLQVLPEEHQKGIRRQENKIISKLYKSARLLSDSDGKLIGNSKAFLEHTIKSTRSFLEEVNSFLNDDWYEMLDFIQQLERPPLKPPASPIIIPN